MRIGAGIPGTHKLGTVNADRLKQSLRRMASGGQISGFTNTVESVRHTVVRPEPLLRIVQRSGTMSFIPGIHGFTDEEIDNSKWGVGT